MEIFVRILLKVSYYIRVYIKQNYEMCQNTILINIWRYDKSFEIDQISNIIIDNLFAQFFI